MPLARRELAALVLRGDALLAAAGPRDRAPAFEFPEHVLHGRSPGERCASVVARRPRLRKRSARSAVGRDYQAPVFGIEAQGSCGGSGSPSCRISIEMLSGERTKAMWPSRGGRLMVTPASIRRWQVS